MSDAAYLDQAVSWSKEMTRMKARGPGDTENAMRQIEREYGIDYGFLWSLRYRRERLRTISASVYEAIAAAYRYECERQARRLRVEIERTETLTGPHHIAVRAAKALVCETGEISAGESLFRGRAGPDQDRLHVPTGAPAKDAPSR